MHNFKDVFYGDGIKTVFKLTFSPMHQKGDFLDNFIKVTLYGTNGKKIKVIKKGMSFYLQELTFTYPIKKDFKIIVEYNRDKYVNDNNIISALICIQLALSECKGRNGLPKKNNKFEDLALQYYSGESKFIKSAIYTVWERLSDLISHSIWGKND